MKKVQLVKIAHARSGDKGDTANVGVIALKTPYYQIIKNIIAGRIPVVGIGETIGGDPNVTTATGQGVEITEGKRLSAVW